MGVNALRLFLVISLMVLPAYLRAETDPFKQPDNMDAAGRAEEAAETQRLQDYYRAQGLDQAVNAGIAYRTNMNKTRTNLADAPNYNSDYIRRANAEAAVDTEYARDDAASAYGVNQGAGNCYKMVGGKPQTISCGDNQARGGASVGPSDYVGPKFLESSKGEAENTNIVGNPKNNPQNRPTLSLRPNP